MIPEEAFMTHLERNCATRDAWRREFRRAERLAVENVALRRALDWALWWAESYGGAPGAKAEDRLEYENGKRLLGGE